MNINRTKVCGDLLSLIFFSLNLLTFDPGSVSGSGYTPNMLPVDYIVTLIQGNSYDSVYRYERHIVFPKMLAQNCPDFSQAQTFYNADLEKEGTARR